MSRQRWIPLIEQYRAEFQCLSLRVHRPAQVPLDQVSDLQKAERGRCTGPDRHAEGQARRSVKPGWNIDRQDRDFEADHFLDYLSVQPRDLALESRPQNGVDNRIGSPGLFPLCVKIFGLVPQRLWEQRSFRES